MGAMKDCAEGGAEFLGAVATAGVDACSALWEYSPDYSSSTSFAGDAVRFAGGAVINATGLALGAGGIAVGVCAAALKGISGFFDD